jgi:repressor LexA
VARRGPSHDRITAKMHALGMKRLKEFADAFGIGRTTVYSLTLGRVSAKGTPVKPSVDTLLKLAAALDVPLHVLVYELEPDAHGAKALAQTPASLLSLPCAIAGWTHGESQLLTAELDPVWVEQSFARGRDLRASSIRGDAMDGGRTPIRYNDTILVDHNEEGTNNTPVVARLVNGRFICRLLKIQAQREVVRLASANPEHLDGTQTVVTPEDIGEIAGRVVRVFHDMPAPPDRKRQR